MAPMTNVESQDGTLPLHYCQKNESYHCAKLLLQYGAHVNRQTEDEEFTPLHVAAQHGLLEHADLYLRYGAAVDKRSINGETPLSVACSHPQEPQDLERYYQVCQHLIQHGANIHTRDKDQQSPLHLACKSANPQVVELLLEKGAEVNVMSYSGNTAMQNILQVTSYKLQNQPELIVRALLNHGAIRVWPGALIKVLRYCYTSPRTVEVLLNTYSKLQGTEETGLRWYQRKNNRNISGSPVGLLAVPQSTFSSASLPLCSALTPGGADATGSAQAAFTTLTPAVPTASL
ncbi:unnamed protein product [Staurois parvus]|uniref:Ankyrin repeat domain-containing protein n=1 Tax=Staurois parvus TaxID=386267 RepID=A0ABN9AKN3_9NEOB|nr:unnamed protein product [Staurois parvus]